MVKLLMIYREQLALRRAMRDCVALLIGVLSAAALGSAFGIDGVWPYLASFAFGMAAITLMSYLLGFYFGNPPLSAGRLFVRFGGFVTMAAGATGMLGVSSPPSASVAWLLILTLGFALLAAVIAPPFHIFGGRLASGLLDVPGGEATSGAARSTGAAPAFADPRKRVLLLSATADDAGTVRPLAELVILCGRRELSVGGARAGAGASPELAAEANDIIAQARALNVSTVVVDDRDLSPPLIYVALLLRYAGLEVVPAGMLAQRVNGTLPVSAFGGDPMLLNMFMGVGWPTLAAKRALDVLLAGAGLIVLAPVLLALGVAIRLESPGPALYRQVRMGRGMRPYEILKLRSMRSDAEKDGKARWAMRNDSRVTRIGRLIRRTRLDELPQFLNVLRGDMSLVGPRPERPELIAELEREIPGYHLRHLVRPGLTGWAQINYPYGASVDDARRKLDFDLYYVRECGIVLDLVIMIRTIRVVLFGEGAR